MSTAGKRSDRVKTERHEVSISDFTAEIVRLGDDEQESKNLLVYGDSNTGKTVLAGTLPERTFWLAGEPGFKSAQRFRKQHSQPPHLGVRRIGDTATALAAVDWLYQRDRYRKLEWLVLDGASTMQDRFRLGYAAEAFDIDPTKRQHRNLPDRPDYFNTQNFLKSWLPMLIDLPVNLLVTAHAYRTDDTADGELLVYPGFQGVKGETANAISGLMDVTAFYQKRWLRTRDGNSKLVRRLWFEQPTPQTKKEDPVRYVVGDKFGVLGDYMDAPSMSKILKLIDGEGEQ